MKTAPQRGAAKKPQQTPRPGVEPGDELYFHHAGQPVSGRVLCHGEHGCTIDHDGEHRKVYWSDVLGHKRRAQKKFEVVDEGEDGAIVKDGTGKSRFVAGPVPKPAPKKPGAKPKDMEELERHVREAAPIAKALPAGRVLFFF